MYMCSYTSLFYPLKGVFEVAGGIGYTIGPPLGGILYEVSLLTPISLNIIKLCVQYNGSFLQ